MYLLIDYLERFMDKEYLDSNYIKASDKKVRRHNYLRYMYAVQHVFRDIQ